MPGKVQMQAGFKFLGPSLFKLFRVSKLVYAQWFSDQLHVQYFAP